LSRNHIHLPNGVSSTQLSSHTGPLQALHEEYLSSKSSSFLFSWEDMWYSPGVLPARIYIGSIFRTSFDQILQHIVTIDLGNQPRREKRSN
jgi:hypothetical protein